MKCYYHPNREIVATCTECGKGLCKECASKWEPTLCDDCAKSRISDKKIALKKSIGLSIAVLVAGAIIGIIMAIQDKRLDNLGLCLTLAFAVAFAVNGWQWLNKIQPNMFLFLPVVGWLIYFFVKFIIAIFVGVVALPVNIYRFWKGNREVNELEAHIKK